MTIDAKDIANILSTSLQLNGDPARQAVATIRGYIYQIWWSVDAWLQLSSADEMIYLEGAEDLDKVSTDHAITEQIKHEAAGISLNNQRAHTALENFWIVRERENARRIDFHYISTATAAMEQDADFGGVCGMEAWRAAQTNLEMARLLQRYISSKLDASGSLRAFLMSASPEEVQSKLIRRFHWFLAQPGVEEVKQSVVNRLTVRLSQKNTPLSYVDRVQDRLYNFVSETIVRSDSRMRRLTAADLLREIDAATVEHISVPIFQYQQFMSAMRAGAFDIGDALLHLMRLPLPGAPSPLLIRPELADRVRSLLSERKSVLLTGTVFKGKTTIAQFVANELCADAWWFPLSLRSGTETDSLIRALAAVIDRESTPALVVIDDIDLSPSSHAAYRHSLALIVSRASRSGRGLLLTARGTSADAVQLSDFAGIEAVDIPEMSAAEVTLHCHQHGCPKTLAPAWGAFISASTAGHPKLVQVRIAELTGSHWPMPSASDVITTSPAIVSAKQVARQILSNSVTPKIAEFVYTAAEANFPLTRPMMLYLIEEIGDIVNGGDVLDNLQGKWLESVLEHRFRVTPILKGAAVEVWTPDARKLAHRRLYDAIAVGRKLDVVDAAALLFHAFIAENASRLTHCVRLLEGIENREISSAIFQQLMWVTYIALSAGQRFFAHHNFVSALLRQLQFSVAYESDSDSISNILDRWIEEVNLLPDDEPRHAMQVLLWSKVVSNRSPKISIGTKLKAIDLLRCQSGEIVRVMEDGVRRVISMSQESPGAIPLEATASQFFLSLQASAVRGLDHFSSLLDWLEFDASTESRIDLELVLGWPLVDSSGAFVHGAWSARHAEETDWAPTISLLIRGMGIASRFKLSKFGSEIARAASIVYGEHMNDHISAMRVLDEAAAAFGDTTTVREQRVNALFQVNEDARALEVWEPMLRDPDAVRSLDAFAFRRAAISACRLDRWADAERYFLGGASTLPELRTEITTYGLIVDACYVAAIGGAPQRAARELAELFLKLPSIATEDGRENWEALLRIVHAICEYIAAVSVGIVTPERKVTFGKASEPSLSFGPPQLGQALRAQLAVVQVGLLASHLGSVPSQYRDLLSNMRASEFPLVRFSSSKALLAYYFNSGTDEVFVDALLAFDRAFNTLASLQDSATAKESDGGDTEPTQIKTEERGWFAVIAAAAICCDHIKSALPRWQAAATTRWGVRSQIAADLSDLSLGLSANLDEAWNLVRDHVKASRAQRVGAALMLLESPNLQPDKVFSIQSFLASATVCHAQGLMLQDDFARPIARRFARIWGVFSASPFLFRSPRVNVPNILMSIANVQDGKASIKALLSAAAMGVGTTLGEIGDRLE